MHLSVRRMMRFASAQNTRRDLRVILAVVGVILSACSGDAAAPTVPTITLAMTAPSDSLFLGRSMRVGATVVNDSASNASARFIWTSSDTTTVVVDSLGTVLGVGTGTALVRAAFQGQSAQRAVRVVLHRADGGITFTEGSANDSRSCAIASAVVYCRAAPTAVDSTPLFVRMPGGAGISFTAVEGSLHAACALATDGRILCWGSNAHFIFARSGTVTTDTGPVAVQTARRFSSFSHGGHAQTCALDRSDNGVYCWGHNDAYQLGRGYLRQEDTTIAPVGGALRASMVSTVGFSTCLIDLVGAAHCSGWLNVNRQALGIDETNSPAEIPLPVVGGVVFRSIASADGGVCGLSTANDAFCWGVNTNGQLGIGTAAAAPTGPQRVLGGLKFALVAPVFRESTCGITLDGDLYCWGQFRPLTISSRLGERAYRPYQLVKGVKFKALTRSISSRVFLCGLTTDGRMYCWD